MDHTLLLVGLYNRLQRSPFISNLRPWKVRPSDLIDLCLQISTSSFF